MHPFLNRKKRNREAIRREWQKLKDGIKIIEQAPQIKGISRSQKTTFLTAKIITKEDKFCKYFLLRFWEPFLTNQTKKIV